MMFVNAYEVARSAAMSQAAALLFACGVDYFADFRVQFV